MDQIISAPGPELPTPELGGIEIAVDGVENIDTNELDVDKRPELPANPAELPSMPSPAPMQDDTSSQQQGVTISGTKNDNNNVPSNVVTPVIADDVDIIEKEWVSKSKQIVAETKDDPHKQSEQLSVVKSDYKSKRFKQQTGEGL